ADLPAEAAVDAASMKEVRQIVENRVDSLGALEPVIQLQGDRRLIIELPGYQNPESAVSLIQQTAQLEFVDFGSLPVNAGTRVTTDLSQERGNTVPASTGGDTDTPEITGTVFSTVLTGDILQSASRGADQLGNPNVVFSLTADGAQQFGDYTTSHVGQYLGIVLDGVVISAPRISEPIPGGQGSISGDFTVEEADRLATQLRYGALPIPLRVDSTSTVGPTLGAISIERSVRAGIVGIIIVVVFMLVYYRLPGASAALALLVFAVINFAIYKFVPITMTLPAITGFLIGIGTAVDGNILIFERMKEELRNGKRLDRAVDAGFDRAFPSIRDSNLSTIIICTVLWLFGTTFGAAAVRGFAVTLALSLMVNLFTAIIVTRTFLYFLMKPVTDETVARRPWLFGL
ncbi:MAG: protein translocase subunit SecD, partial [Anaerolineae bacterium]|nr:protein translocase subunit SecD [Anaerolineae bacterium]